LSNLSSSVFMPAKAITATTAATTATTTALGFGFLLS
jgi:hypothetical protein